MPSIISALLGGSAKWGVTEEETLLEYPADKLGMIHHEALWRGITINAPAAIVFRWLLQLKVAPYSYDLLDNLGRESPRVLTPGLENLKQGQTFMFVFRLTGFEKDKSLTMTLRPGSILGDGGISYLILESGDGSVRLLAKLLIRHAPGPLGWPARLLLAPGDLVMMRKQFLTIKQLAEEQAAGKPG
jgi:hypothetical protein